MRCFVSILVLKRKRKLVALLLLSYRCIVTINVTWLFLTVPLAGLQCVIVLFPDHTQLLFKIIFCFHKDYYLRKEYAGAYSFL